MHIVFLCDDTTKSSDANLGICHNLAKEFLTRGYQVSILGNCEHPGDLREETVDGISYYRFYYPINRVTHQILNHYHESHSLPGLALDLLRHPAVACVDVTRALTGYNPIERKYVQLLNAVHRKTPVDVAIASSGSFYTIHALAKAGTGCIRIGYMLDPYWKNHTTGGKRAKKEELYAWERLDRMVIPKLLEADYADPAFALWRHKLVTAEFPGIMDQIPAETAISFDKDKVNLLFAGNFYEKIRGPEYLFSLMDAMPEHVCLNILGGVYGSFAPEVLAHMDKLVAKGKLKMLGTVPAAQARAAMRQADFLVNLGNAIENQLPSKIFEYFSTGKPVIHIQKIPSCPCLPYLERYQNGLVLSEAETVSQNAEKTMAFCAAGTKTLPCETVRSRFAECTIPYVADLILNKIR